MKRLMFMTVPALLACLFQPALSQQRQKDMMNNKSYEYCVLKTTSNTGNWQVAKLYCGCCRDLINNEKKSIIEAAETCGKPLGIVPDVR